MELGSLGLCEVSRMVQIMSHLVEECTVHSFPEGMKGLYRLEGGTVQIIVRFEKRYVIL